MDTKLLERYIQAMVKAGQLEGNVPLTEGNQSFSVGLKAADERRGKLIHASELRNPPEIKTLTALVSPLRASSVGSHLLRGTPEEITPAIEQEVHRILGILNSRSPEATK